ncbi:MAG: hypothetical protein KJT01_13310 [Gemmatimonadetes bacterium]|nr:hypothetical protein [Gemmatimonadota bacterium]
MRRTSRLAASTRVGPSDPIGIVIADGGRGDRLPRVAAFVWGPFPDEDAEWTSWPVAEQPARDPSAEAAAVP